MTLRTLLVDDEPLARERLRLLLEPEQDVSIVAECRNGREAASFLESNEVDLMFLDIEMPGMSGLDLMEEIGLLELPATVFVTAFEQHAVKAFDLQAIDYLTKPVEQPRLERALARVREKYAAHRALLTQSQFTAMLAELRAGKNDPTSYPGHLLVRDGTKEVLVPVETIEWIEACDYYSGLHVGNRTLLLRESITALSRRLNPTVFLRIHRSTLVNLHCVHEIHREGAYESTVLLNNGKQLRMSKKGRDNMNRVVGTL